MITIRLCAAAIAAVALSTLLTSCIVVPVGGPHAHYYHHRDWR